jgi:TonB family protein
MSVVPQVRDLESATIPAADPEMRIATPVAGRDNPLSLLREAITRLNSSGGELPDQAQMAGLLAEVQEALDRANVIARAAAECEELLREGQFEKAVQVLDASLVAYPDDPALLTRRHDVEARQRAFQSAATVRTALEEAQWLVKQNRLDLAAHFLKEKAADLPDQPALAARLREIEALLPQWEQDRHVQAALGRVAALEELQQWQVALTTVEEALQSFSASEELTGAARRVRDRLADQERQNRLARRLELIGQKIAATSWKQALALLESTQAEFPGVPELTPLRREVEAGLRHAECEAIVAEVRQCLADGEPDHAEQILRRGLESLGQEAALEALSRELKSERHYREEFRSAQLLFGRRQLAEAERVLAGLVSQDRPEAQALLQAVRQAKAVTEEENFFERGREKALKLMQQQQFAQAADLLRNLHSLFPGNPILERDLLAAQAALDRAPRITVAPEAEQQEENREPQQLHIAPPSFGALRLKPEASPVEGRTVRIRISPGARRTAIAGTAVLVLISAGLGWKLSHGEAPVTKPSVPVAPKPLQAVVPPPPVTPAVASPVVKAAPPAAIQQKPSAPPPPPPAARQPSATTSTAPASEGTQDATPRARYVKSFVPPGAKQTPVQAQSQIPLPPETAVVSAEMLAPLSADLVRPNNVPVPPLAAAPRAAAPPVPPAAPKPPAPVSKLEEAQLVERALPEYPDVARQRRIFGTVQIEATIDEKGTVKTAKVLSGDPILSEAARNSVLKWKYKAATLNGQPIATTRTIRVSFANAK